MYLPNREATLEYEICPTISAQEYENLMNKGWRKFGAFVFHPICRTCKECRPIRVPVNEFKANRSQRRALKRNEDLEVRIARPEVDSARLRILERYHAARSAQKGWPFEPVSAANYAMTYLMNPVPSVEIGALDRGELVAVALADITPNAVSGIYHYYDPDRAERCLGKFIMLACIDAARKLGKPYFYLGYHVAGCASMSYKSTFEPCEILDENGEWVRA